MPNLSKLEAAIPVAPLKLIVMDSARNLGNSREFDTSFFIIVIQILCLSRFRLIFLSNFMILCVLFCAFCCIIDSIGGFLNVYQYHWQQR